MNTSVPRTRAPASRPGEAGAPMDAMAGVPEVFDEPTDRARFKRVAHRPGIELYRAHIVHHAFRPHCHDAYGLGAIERGIERFRYRGSEHLAGPGSLVLMDDDELHTGRAETDEGWRYRMIYIERPLLNALLGLPEGASPHFRQAAVDAPTHGAQATALLDALWTATEDPLQFDGLLAEFAQRIVAPNLPPAGAEQAKATHREPVWLPRVREYIEAHLLHPLDLERLAREAGLSPFHFLRSFKAALRVTPHAYVQARRVFRAKQLLARGIQPADAATAVGLVDQAHLSKWMKVMFGVTPGAYSKSIRG
ncbi:AraC family transcriptional regulator [Piscinibacterium candidicorallinum]|uniref:AraC family ligand binding domain-containing protein n=1 Tax=Piscinibacterium candidicorallinum TaxID=1793872 RepID=A0ABV7H3F4_9BURK